jgi:type I restriction enzyme R subunit
VQKQLRDEVAAMPLDNFIVRAKRRYVEKFLDPGAWTHLGEEDRHELVEHVAGLPTGLVDSDVDAKRFDLLCLRIQIAMLRGAAFQPLRAAFVRHVHQLEAKGAVPDVARQMALILEVQTDDWWTDATPQMVEIARRRLRGLMSLIEPARQVIVTTDVGDVMGAKREIELVDLGGASSLAQFRRKARAYVDAHADHVTLARLRQGRPLTPSDLDELHTLFVGAGVAQDDDFRRVRQMPDLPAFIRSLVGLDRRAAQAAFNEALADTTLSARQIDFIERIVDYLTALGRMDPAALYEAPFTDSAPNGVSDMFGDATVGRIVTTIRQFEPRLDIAL